MSDKTGRKPTKTTHSNKPVEEDFSLREDGRYNFWQKIPVVDGHTETPHNPVWVIRGVFKKIPKWA